MVGEHSTFERLRPVERHPAEQGRAVAKSRLRQRRGELLSDLAARLLSGQDLDREVMPALYRALAEERIVDASLGYIVTDMDEGMKLGFMEGFDRAMVQRCLTGSISTLSRSDENGRRSYST